MTRVADRGLDGLFVGVARAVVAGVLAAVLLLVTRQPWPARHQWRALAVTAGGVVVGFPVLTSIALHGVPASHAAVTIGLLPAMTAVTAVLRTGERLPGRFWTAVGLGAAATVAFSVQAGGGPGGIRTADVLLLGAVVAAAIGYTEGGLLARTLGPWQTICWSLVLVLPGTALTTALLAHAHPVHATAGQWAAFGYLGVVSMFLGFFAWYRGLAIGPIARISQVQLVQPVLSILWSALLLRERLSPFLLASAAVVICCATLAVRTRARVIALGPAPR